MFFKAALASFSLSAILSAGSANAEGTKDSGPAPRSAAASSDASKSAGAKELFKEGRKLAEKGDYQGACSKFEQSLELEDGIGTRFNLADCYEHLGRTATAYEMFVEVAESSRKQGQTQREGVAQSRAEALAGKLARLLIQVEPQERVIQIRRDGEKLDSASLGSPVALDPGTYELSASAPGLEEWTSKVELPPGPIVVQVNVPKLKEEPRAPAPIAKEELKPEPKPAAPEREMPRRGDRHLQTGTVILGGAGLAAMVASVTFGLQYQTSNSDARAVCRASVDCTPEELSLHTSLVEDAKKARTLAYVSVGAGTVLLGTALLLYLNSAEDEHPPHAVRALPTVAQDGSVGATLIGSF
jgi:tetratricopeptide (TPR) repeat protein